MDELRRRAKAASALTGIPLAHAAIRMGMSDSTLKRKLDATDWKKRYEREAFIRQLADELAPLPYDFFTISWNELLARLQQPASDSEINRVAAEEKQRVDALARAARESAARSAASSRAKGKKQGADGQLP